MRGAALIVGESALSSPMRGLDTHRRARRQRTISEQLVRRRMDYRVIEPEARQVPRDRYSRAMGKIENAAGVMPLLYSRVAVTIV
jgi:hypothetical protein